MTILVLNFPKLGVKHSTWVEDEWWSSLSRIQQEQHVFRHVKNAHHSLLNASKSTRYSYQLVSTGEDYTWHIL
jgi:hypothetical protein